jgi:hypothetical protein
MLNLIYIALGVFALAMILSPSFRNKVLVTLRIRANDVLDKSTTPLEREKDEYEQLMAKLPKQRAAVISVMASANVAKKDLATALTQVEEAAKTYKEAKALGASEAALNEAAAKYSAAEEAVEAQKKIVAEATAAADEARRALESTAKALAKFAARIEQDERKTQLAEALRVAGEAVQQSRDIDSVLSRAGQYSRDIDKELEEARAGADLSKGTPTEQELERLRQEAATKAAREKLDKLG